jgi:hypothetical protein
MPRSSVHVLAFDGCLFQLYLGEVVGGPHFLVPRKLTSFWRNLWLRKKASCDGEVRYRPPQWCYHSDVWRGTEIHSLSGAARRDAWAACQISTQVACNKGTRPALEGISSLPHFFSLSSFFHLSFISSLLCFLPPFLSNRFSLSFYLTARVPVDRGPPPWIQLLHMRVTS